MYEFVFLLGLVSMFWLALDYLLVPAAPAVVLGVVPEVVLGVVPVVARHHFHLPTVFC